MWIADASGSLTTTSGVVLSGTIVACDKAIPSPPVESTCRPYVAVVCACSPIGEEEGPGEPEAEQAGVVLAGCIGRPASGVHCWQVHWQEDTPVDQDAADAARRCEPVAPYVPGEGQRRPRGVLRCRRHDPGQHGGHVVPGNVADVVPEVARRSVLS